MSQDAAARLCAGIAHEFRRRLLGEMLPRICHCLGRLDEQRAWQRPAPNCNSAGNLVLHLCGNAAQWILAGLGGEPDQRARDAEFAADGGVPVAELELRLGEVWTRCCAVVDALPLDAWLGERTFQQRYRETGLAAVLHVLEHASGHAGQIYAWTKQVTGEDLRFYDL